MSGLAEPLFVFRLRGPVSSSPLLVDIDRDGWPEVFVGGPVLTGLRCYGKVLDGWPRKARRPFASSPASGDIDGDGRGEIVCGCDDGTIHAFRADATPLRGWPVRTDADVFSTPAIADLDGDKIPEVVVGSDDGSLRVLRGDGSPSWRADIPLQPFISASPTVSDMNGDGVPEVVVGAWDRRMHMFSAQGRELPAKMPMAGNVIWSSATSFEIKGRGRHIAWAADRLYVASGGGTILPGWPARTSSWMVSSPAIAELSPGEGASIIVGAERLCAWDLLGRVRRGWPVDAGDFVWSSPVVADIDGDGSREVVVGSWDGGIYAFKSDGSIVQGFPLRTDGPVFSTPAIAPLRGGGGLLVAASWDGSVRGWRLPDAKFIPGDWPQFRGSPERTGNQQTPFDMPMGPPAIPADSAARPKIHNVVLEKWAGVRRAVIDGENLEAARAILMHYQIRGEGKTHIVPAVNSRGHFVAMFQPLRLPHIIQYWVEVEDSEGKSQRWPTEGTKSFVTRRIGH